MKKFLTAIIWIISAFIIGYIDLIMMALYRRWKSRKDRR